MNDAVPTQTTDDARRCGEGHGIFARSQLSVRRGQLQCPVCLPRGLVGTLVPASHVQCRECGMWKATSPCSICTIEKEAA